MKTLYVDGRLCFGIEVDNLDQAWDIFRFAIEHGAGCDELPVQSEYEQYFGVDSYEETYWSNYKDHFKDNTGTYADFVRLKAEIEKQHKIETIKAYMKDRPVGKFEILSSDEEN